MRKVHLNDAGMIAKDELARWTKATLPVEGGFARVGTHAMGMGYRD
jgi:hypothetical protein